jgi:hypothetical protein
MLGLEVTSPTTLIQTSTWRILTKWVGDVIMYVAGLQYEGHGLARNKLHAVKKPMKRDHDLHLQKKTNKVGDLMYWRRIAEKKVQSVWLGPGL